jgi:hypothetical protein
MSLSIKSDPQWFNSLTTGEQIKFFPSYVSVLHALLAQAKIREKNFIEAIDTAFEVSHGDVAICKACFKVGNPLTCVKCEEHGCGNCNTTTKGLVKCGICCEDYCWKCDPLVLEDGLTQERLDRFIRDEWDLDTGAQDWSCSKCSS